MKIETIAVTNLPNHAGLIELKKSLIKHGVEHEIIVTPWQGFFTKVNEAYKYAKECTADYILFVDAHDVLFVGAIADVVERINKFPEHDCIFSAEKACWPSPELADQYPPSDSQWKYLNSGTYLFKPKKLVETVDKLPPEIGIDDQLYFTQHLLNDRMNCILDINCEIFQTLAHDNGDSFGMVDGKFTNNVTGSNPVVVHGNGLALEEFDYNYLTE